VNLSITSPSDSPSLLQLCFPLIPFFSSNGWGLERKWWKQTCVRKGTRSKDKWFRKIMYGDVKSGRMKDLRKAAEKEVGRGSEVGNGKEM
jgi:hypothetical protein